MTIEQERLEAIRALTRIEDAGLIRRVRSLLAVSYLIDERTGIDVVMEERGPLLANRMTEVDDSIIPNTIDLGKYVGKITEKVDLDKLRAQQQPQKLDTVAFNEAADAIEWEHSIEELLAMLD